MLFLKLPQCQAGGNIPGGTNAGGSHASGVPAVGKGGFAIRERDCLLDPPQVQSGGSPLRWGGRLGPTKLSWCRWS